eukprot:CAMPEP_0194145984 /NCGR_PEP_ID=MMETSP0152-20130528/19107_1 /TAXON_ID=1049557 /ORGANISM="Thalassiothrix antarctica, Strain L6-D1" /LENGTH=70 /DNA_ID=CAMNT_0038846379 /DNA_START=72 /DNA_END=281 /DNA_ORIENTATION=-
MTTSNNDATKKEEEVTGGGFKDAETARRTIEMVEKEKPRNKQILSVNAYLNRARNHSHQTPAMKEAIEIF